MHPPQAKNAVKMTCGRIKSNTIDASGMNSRTTSPKGSKRKETVEPDAGKKAPVKRMCVSLHESTLAAGKRAAKRDGRSFSNYVAQLIQRDATATV
ncbi:MAG: hypothetical protein V4710_15565 [Verrucomicrobiota bacterium]